MVNHYLLRLIEEAHRDPWRRLPTGPDDEFGWAKPIYWVSWSGRVLATFWKGSQPRLQIKAQRLENRPGNRRAHARTNLTARNDAGSPRYRPVRIHRLVAAAWAVCGEGPVVRHLQGDPLNNSASNLAYGTYTQNLLDQYALGERAPAVPEEQLTFGDLAGAVVEYEPDPVLGF